MMQRQMSFFAVALACLAGTAPAAHAYIGPGAGISAIGTVIALIAAVLLAIVGFVWYPLKRLFRKRKSADKAGAEASRS